jgi:hypothetical protein
MSEVEMNDEYLNEKTIDKLDPIPARWTHAEKSRFLKHGYLAMSGETPAGVMRTKRIDLDTMFDILPGAVVWIGHSEPRQSDGTFSLVEENNSQAHKSDKNLSCSDGKLTVVHGGWYHIQGNLVLSGGGSNNEYRTATVTLEIAGTPVNEEKITLDLSIPDVQHRMFTADVYITYENSSVSFLVEGLAQDSLVTAKLDTLSVHELSAIVGNINDNDGDNG